MLSSQELVTLVQDGEAIRTVLSGGLRPVDGTRLSIRGISVDYFRQSPTRISAQYTLELETDGGQRGSQTITLAHFADGRTASQWSRMNVDAPDANEPVGPFRLPGAWHSPELQSIFQTFPFDFRLPGLRALVAGAPELVRLLVPESAGEVASWRAEVVRYRPDMRAMLRVQAAAGHGADSATHRAYAKAFRDTEDGQRAFDLLLALSEPGADASAFRVPRPLGYDPAYRVLMLREAPGERLLEIVRGRDREAAADAVRRAARAVAAMHQSNVPEGLLPVVRELKDVQFAEVADRLIGGYPQFAPRLQAVTERIDATFQPAPPSPTHFDLKQGHMLIAGDGVTILDFDKMGLGDPLIDVANIVATLGAEREGSARRAARRGNLAEIFVDEYFRHVPAEWAPLFPAHLARAALLEAATTGRGMRGRKSSARPAERLASALQRAEEALAS